MLEEIQILEQCITDKQHLILAYLIGGALIALTYEIRRLRKNDERYPDRNR